MNELEGWPWRPDLCPADADFIDWLKEHGAAEAWTPPSVFHMGTGLHHKVGLYCARNDIPCLGVTASRAEYETWVRRSRLRVSCYEVHLGNVNHGPVPSYGGRYFEVMSLFHLGEMPDRYPLHPEVIDRLVSKVTNRGQVLLYMGSSGYERAVEWAKASPQVRPVGTYKSLAIFDRGKEIRSRA